MNVTSKFALMIGAAAVIASAVGLGAGTASADPTPPPSAPRKPAEMWQGQPVVWAWLPAGGHWGVWLNGDFMPLT